MDKETVETFWNTIQKDYNLTTWKLEWWKCKSEAECADDMKSILLGECSTTKATQYLLLHEVAHILAGPRLMHRPEWWRMFMGLLKRYNMKKHPHDNYKDYYNPEGEK